MRSPLQNIIGYTEIGRVTLGDAEKDELQSFFDSIYTAGMRLTDTTISDGESPEGTPAISFEVVDQGCGIPEDELAAVFEPFYESTRTANGAGGTGLGLPLSRCIVQHHGGTIAISNHGNGGMCCTVVLPAQCDKKTLPT